jgi:hypothetical protein
MVGGDLEKLSERLFIHEGLLLGNPKWSSQIFKSDFT